MKKNILLRKILVSALAGAAVLSTTVYAENLASIINSGAYEEDLQKEETQPSYVVYSGKVISVTENDKGNIRVEIDNEKGNGIIATLQQDVIVIDSENPTGDYKKINSIKEGMEVSFIIPANSPMAMSYPPMTGSVKVVVIGSEAKNYGIYSFDENLVNKENTLKLNIDDKVKIVNIKGEEQELTAEDVKNSQSIVFYTFTTRSIPAQTTPEMIMILENETSLKPSDDDALEEETAEFVGLRQEFESLGYEVKWTSNDLPIVIEKEGKTIAEIKLGEEKALVNGETVKLTLTTKLEDNKIFVSNEIFEGLK